jgi:hypothetical protein
MGAKKKVGGSGRGRSRHGLYFFAKAKDSGKEVRGRLSGHGFSTGRREERRRMRSEFPRWGNERADEPESEPFFDFRAVVCYQ